MKFLQSIPLFGSIVNGLAIIVCGFIGYTLRKRVREDVMELPKQCLGLFSAIIGIGMALKTQNMLVVVFSLCAGSIIGGLLDIDGRVERMVEHLQARHSGLCSNFTQGLMSAMLIFCIGSMAVLGAFEEGLGGYPTLLLTKSMMDGLISVALAATFGVGVMFSSIPVFLYQGSLTLAARFVQPYMTEAATIEMTATGGVMLFGVGLSILGLVKMKLMNALPGLVIAVVLVRLFVE
ncbi:MAG: DUF554 domain-containing protein [Pyramidobacter sp.]|nr:DUF554 domain-containing protein [Pyramidobacter sp.]